MDSISARRPITGVARAPGAAVLCTVVVAGLAAASCTVLLALTSDHIPEPGVHAGLAVWGILGFVFAGVVAWWRRPEIDAPAVTLIVLAPDCAKTPGK